MAVLAIKKTIFGNYILVGTKKLQEKNNRLFSVRIFKQIFSKDFEGFARPKRKQSQNYFQKDFQFGFSVEILSKSC